jgi:hypothetical protein
VGVSGGVSIFQIFKNLKNHKNLSKKIMGCVSGCVRGCVNFSNFQKSQKSQKSLQKNHGVCQGVCQFFKFSKISKPKKSVGVSGVSGGVPIFRISKFPNFF